MEQTLKQLILEEYRQKYIEAQIADENDDVNIDVDPALKGVEKWLTLKRLEIEQKHNSTAQHILINELLEELNSK